jgi:hypothetical protein
MFEKYILPATLSLRAAVLDDRAAKPVRALVYQWVGS